MKHILVITFFFFGTLAFSQEFNLVGNINESTGTGEEFYKVEDYDRPILQNYYLTLDIDRVYIGATERGFLDFEGKTQEIMVTCEIRIGEDIMSYVLGVFKDFDSYQQVPIRQVTLLNDYFLNDDLVNLKLELWEVDKATNSSLLNMVEVLSDEIISSVPKVHEAGKTITNVIKAFDRLNNDDIILSMESSFHVGRNRTDFQRLVDENREVLSASKYMIMDSPATSASVAEEQRKTRKAKMKLLSKMNQEDLPDASRLYFSFISAGRPNFTQEIFYRNFDKAYTELSKGSRINFEDIELWIASGIESIEDSTKPLSLEDKQAQIHYSKVLRTYATIQAYRRTKRFKTEYSKKDFDYLVISEFLEIESFEKNQLELTQLEAIFDDYQFGIYKNMKADIKTWVEKVNSETSDQ